MADEDLNDIISVLEELCDDSTVPKNIKSKFSEIIKSLNSQGDMVIKINKALHDLDEIADDTNIQPFIRTQIWNLVSMLEKACS
jgi:uncharacterized protein (UPF0147 family)